LEGASAAGQVLEKTLVTQGLHVGKGGVGAIEAEMGGYFAKGGGESVGVLLTLDEAEDLLLSGC
jgi:hypothetical protein